MLIGLVVAALLLTYMGLWFIASINYRKLAPLPRLNQDLLYCYQSYSVFLFAGDLSSQLYYKILIKAVFLLPFVMFWIVTELYFMFA